MNKNILLLYFVFFGFTCFGQNVSQETVVSRLSDYLTTSNFEEANVFFKEHKDVLDSTTADIFLSVINIGLSSKGNTINVESTIDCIKRVINEFAIHKEELRSMPTGMMAYFNIYVSYLGNIGNPYCMDVYRLFKEVWPTIDNDNSLIYIYVLENASIYAFTEKHYFDAIPILEELIEYGNKGYKLSSKPYANYAYLGRCYQNTGSEDKAAIWYDKALMNFSSKNKIEDLSTYMNVVRDRFEVAFKLSQFSKCRELGQLLIDYYNNKESCNQDYINVSLELAEIELSSFNTKKGIFYYEKALGHILNSPNYNYKDRRAFLENLYTIYNTNSVNEKERKYQSEIETYNINTEKRITIDVVNDQYIDSLKKIVSYREKGYIDNVKRHVDDVEILSSHYSAINQELQGIKLIERTINLLIEQKVNEQYYSKLYSSIGTLYSNLQNIGKAIEYHKKAFNIYNKNGILNADYINILCYLAEDYRSNGDFAIAKAHLDEAWELSLSMDAFKTEKTIYYHLLQSYSELYKDLGDEENALLYNSMMIEDTQANDDASNVFKKVNQYARIQLLLYFDRYIEAKKVLEDIGDEYIEKYKGWWTAYETMFFNNDESCVNYLEHISKNDRMNIMRSYSSFHSSYLKDYWDVYGGNLNMAYSMALYKFNTPSLRTSTYNNLLFTKNFQLELNKFNRAHPNEVLTSDMLESVLQKIGNINNVKDKLRENEVAVEFFFIKNRITFREIENKYGALVLRKDLSEPIFIELCICDSLDKLVYSNTQGEAHVYAEKMYNINSDKLYNLIWKPLEDEIPTKSTVYISGCGATLYINMSALSNGKVRLNELYDIHNVVSTSFINSDRGDNRTYRSATLFGGINYDTSMDVMAADAIKYTHNDITKQYAMLRGGDERGSWRLLKFSLEETNNIAAFLSEKNVIVTKHIQSDASEEAFKSLSEASPDIIHISTHGFYYQPYMHNFRSEYSNHFFANENNNRLNYNGLLFSGANNAWRYNKYQDNVDDGILTAQEIYPLNLSNTSLLILSACQTGLGENNEIDGNEGLSRAFKIAGVDNIMMTLWNVSDNATSKFMELYYISLMERKNPRAALDETVNKIKNSMPDPYYWAPFIIVE